MGFVGKGQASSSSHRHEEAYDEGEANLMAGQHLSTLDFGLKIDMQEGRDVHDGSVGAMAEVELGELGEAGANRERAADKASAIAIERFTSNLGAAAAAAAVAATAKQPAETLHQRWQRLSKVVWMVFEEPMSSRAGLAVYGVIMAAILVSVTTLCLETIPFLAESVAYRGIFETIEIVCTIIFSVEFLTRLATSPDKLAFALTPLNVVDLAAILPFYVHLALQEASVQGDMMLRELRMLRIARLLKMLKSYSGVQIFFTAMQRSSQALGMLVFALSFGVVLFSSVIYFCERDYNPVGFGSIPQTFWWGIVTMTTVGYGDVVPITILGRLVAACTMVAGLLFLSLPMSVIGSHFTEVMHEYNAARRAQERSATKKPWARPETRVPGTLPGPRDSTPAEDQLEPLMPATATDSSPGGGHASTDSSPRVMAELAALRADVARLEACLRASAAGANHGLENSGLENSGLANHGLESRAAAPAAGGGANSSPGLGDAAAARLQRLWAAHAELTAAMAAMAAETGPGRGGGGVGMDELGRGR